MNEKGKFIQHFSPGTELQNYVVDVDVVSTHSVRGSRVCPTAFSAAAHVCVTRDVHTYRRKKEQRPLKKKVVLASFLSFFFLSFSSKRAC